ncbi:MAG: flippase-like domain-containing protein [Rhodospirillales bacterium]|nr:flippase-like domain-containing protein [Alphaproteobacteria bacterium]MBL6947494.1 flippase-like domain-containing protein [Rhodospirillales bacterium]
MSKKWLAVALKFLVSGFLIWFLTRGIDFSSAAQRVAEADPVLLLAAVLVILIQICVGGLRWRAVLVAMGASFPIANAVRLFWIGSFFSQALPSSVGGDPVRMYKAYKLGLSVREAVNGVLLERVVTVAALVLLVDSTQPWFMPQVDHPSTQFIMPAVILITLGAIGGIAVLLFLDRLPGSLMRWRLVRGLGNLGADGRSVFLSKGHLPLVMFWGVLTHINISLAVFLLALSLNLNVTLLDCLTLVPLVMLIMTIPISIGGWGVRETAMVALFGLIGVSNEGALVLSVLIGLVGMVTALPGGLIWLVSRDKGETLDHPSEDLPPITSPVEAEES